MRPPALPEALPPPLPDPPPAEREPYTGDGCPPGVDPTTCCVCSDHTEFEDPSHPHWHKFNDRALADELLEYLIEKERALDAERAELADDEEDEDGIDEALGELGDDDFEDDADDEDGSLADELARRVVRPLPRSGRRATLSVVTKPPAVADEDDVDGTFPEEEEDNDDQEDESGSEPPSSPESPTLAQMARAPPPTLQLGQKWVIRRAPPNVGQPPVGTAPGVEFDAQGRLKLGGSGGVSRFAQREQQERRHIDIVAGVAALSVDDKPERKPHSDGRKIPSPLAGDHSSSGRASPSPQLLATLPPLSADPACGLETMSSYLFPSFPALPVGYTRQIPPLPFSLRTRLVLARVSPSCRANIWAKAIWAERKAIVGRHGSLKLTDDEARAVHFAGVAWGKGLLSEAVDITHPKFRKENSRRALRGSIRGVQQKLSKDGLSLYAVVREEADWTSGAKKVSRLPVPEWLNTFAFTFKAESEAAETAGRINRTLLALQQRLRQAPAERIEVSSAIPGDLEATGLASLPPRASSYSGITLAHSVGGSGADGDQKKEKKVCLRRAADAKKKGGDGKLTASGDNSGGHATAVEGEQPKKLSSSAKKAARKKAAAAAAAAAAALAPVDKAPLSLPEHTPYDAPVVGPVLDSADSPPPVLPPAGVKKKTKKKRSALANNSNPHHMKNYVPTRLVSDQPSQVFNPHAFMASIYFPPPTRFLTATPAKLKASAAAAPPVQPAAGEDASPAPGTDEYMCVFCEYTLLYGDSPAARRKLVSKRKKLLARKERARERASGVANGTKTFASGTGGGSKQIRKPEQDDEDAYEGGEDWECDDEILSNGQCRRCSERRAHELDRKHKKNKKKKKAHEKAVSVSTAIHPAGFAADESVDLA